MKDLSGVVYFVFQTSQQYWSHWWKNSVSGLDLPKFRSTSGRKKNPNNLQSFRKGPNPWCVPFSSVIRKSFCATKNGIETEYVAELIYLLKVGGWYFKRKYHDLRAVEPLFRLGIVRNCEGWCRRCFRIKDWVLLKKDIEIYMKNYAIWSRVSLTIVGQRESRGKCPVPPESVLVSRDQWSRDPVSEFELRCTCVRMTITERSNCLGILTRSDLLN